MAPRYVPHGAGAPRVTPYAYRPRTPILGPDFRGIEREARAQLDALFAQIPGGKARRSDGTARNVLVRAREAKR